MGVKIGAETVGGFKIGAEIVGGMKVGTEIIYRAAAPVATVLYAIATVGSLHHLVSINKATGVATRVSNNTLGVGVYGGSLAWDGVNLFTANVEPAALYTVDRTTGVATRVGSARNFGVNIAASAGLAWDGTNLLLTAENRVASPSFHALYTVDRTTSVATRVGTEVLDSSKALAWDGSTLFMLDNGRDALFTVDRTTGVETRVGAATRFGADLRYPSGLAWDGANLFMVDELADRLYTVDRTTGVATRVGTATNFGLGPRRPAVRGLVFAPAPATSD